MDFTRIIHNICGCIYIFNILLLL